MDSPGAAALSNIRGTICLSLALLMSVGCGADGEPPSALNEDAADSSATISREQNPQSVGEVGEARELPSILGAELEAAHRDLDGIIEAGYLRALVGYSHTHYFMDGLVIRGITADTLKEFGPYLQQQLSLRQPKDGSKKRVGVLPVPVARDEMISFLVDGLGDLAMGNITITEDRAARVDFSVPILSDVSELVVHSSSAEPIADLDGLSGRTVHVRASSSFFESIQALNRSLVARGMAPVIAVPVDEHLQTEDILELVNAGAIEVTVADSHMAGFWKDVFENIDVRQDLALSTGREIGWAIRKNVPGLKPMVDDFIRRHREGTLVGNVLLKRYLKDNRYVHNAAASTDRKRFQSMTELFRRYSKDYEFDWLLIAAQAYQESRLIQSRRSPVGAVGVMQLLPSTASSPPVAIPDIEDLEANIHAGHKYLRHIADHYFDDPDIDELNRHLFAFAAYNAGPTRISRLRRIAAERGLDPNQWFSEVERVVAEQVGREPVTYVRNIFKYYVTYKLMQDTATFDQSP